VAADRRAGGQQHRGRGRADRTPPRARRGPAPWPARARAVACPDVTGSWRATALFRRQAALQFRPG
jgi:hypothetical protein